MERYGDRDRLISHPMIHPRMRMNPSIISTMVTTITMRRKTINRTIREKM